MDDVSSLTWPSSSTLNRIAAPIVETFVGWYCLKGRVKRKNVQGCVYIARLVYICLYRT